MRIFFRIDLFSFRKSGIDAGCDRYDWWYLYIWLRPVVSLFSTTLRATHSNSEYTTRSTASSETNSLTIDTTAANTREENKLTTGPSIYTTPRIQVESRHQKSHLGINPRWLDKSIFKFLQTFSRFINSFSCNTILFKHCSTWC